MDAGSHGHDALVLFSCVSRSPVSRNICEYPNYICSKVIEFTTLAFRNEFASLSSTMIISYLLMRIDGNVDRDDRESRTSPGRGGSWIRKAQTLAELVHIALQLSLFFTLSLPSKDFYFLEDTHL